MLTWSSLDSYNRIHNMSASHVVVIQVRWLGGYAGEMAGWLYR